MNVGESLLIFLGIPIGFGALVYVRGAAGSWTRSGRAGDVARATGVDGPLFMTSSASAPDPSILPAEIGTASVNVTGGGAHGRW